jgi:hypothetical protein
MYDKYRLIYYISDATHKYVIAAFVAHQHTVSLVIAGRLPDKDQLGGWRKRAKLAMLLKLLRNSSLDFYKLPPEVSQCATLGKILSIPDTVTYPAAWVANRLLRETL